MIDIREVEDRFREAYTLTLRVYTSNQNVLESTNSIIEAREIILKVLNVKDYMGNILIPRI